MIYESPITKRLALKNNNLTIFSPLISNSCILFQSLVRIVTTLPSTSPTAIVYSSSDAAICVIYASQSSIDSSVSYLI